MLNRIIIYYIELKYGAEGGIQIDISTRFIGF
ncbi:hypothetical protein SAMN04488698_1136 [Candidatus Frackibacter sp. WG12]|nr:hypothetical protein SAMN04515661_1146 [Candidatus Frackibacter sp. WG11]SEM70777.1 hypothetical protein SAMN04488698_1136 [Candidatus Frackibacter sp. WG12]SFL83583.1 hypothetical protein SAMN04488699_11577 [Candidatus Frackibacter sp. WG13]